MSRYQDAKDQWWIYGYIYVDSRKDAKDFETEVDEKLADLRQDLLENYILKRVKDY